MKSIRQIILTIALIATCSCSYAISTYNPLTSDNINNETYDNKEVSVYMRNMQKTIKSKWKPPKFEQSYAVVVRYKIKRDGTIKDIHIKTTSGNKENDKAAIKAIKSIKKLPPLPASLQKHEHIDIQFNFEYNSIKH